MAGGPKDPDRGGWKFYCWDSDIILQDVRNNPISKNVPDGLFQSLLRHDDFVVLFRDRVYKYCFNDGALTPARVAESYNYRMEEIFLPIVVETARWQPSSARRLPWDRDGEWTDEWNLFKNEWFPQRTNLLLDQLRKTRIRGVRLYPIDTPEFARRGGPVDVGYAPKLSAGDGTVYYTTDGTDPRLPGGEISPSARAFAGGKVPVDFVESGAEWKYYDAGDDLGTAWREPAFDDAAWPSGPAQLGYGENDQATTVGTGPDPLLKNPTTYFRLEFNVSRAAAVSDLWVDVLRDDGAAVYINGTEVVRDNLPPGELLFETLALDGASGQEESSFFSFEIPAEHLVEGSNVLAVEVHQNSIGSSDLSFDLKLSGLQFSGEADIVIEEPTLIRARALDGEEWSGINEALFTLSGTALASAENTLVSEIHYNPDGDDTAAAEFVELHNTSDVPVDLSNVSFADGVQFVFPLGTILPPRGFAVVTGAPVAFDALYNAVDSPWKREQPVDFHGGWKGSLSNGGERLVLLAPDGTEILQVDYEDAAGWPGRADGLGSSLELVSLDAPQGIDARSAWLSEPSNWAPSSRFHGSPGESPMPPGVVINEALAAGEQGQSDFVELHNTTSDPVDVSGWFLSEQRDGSPGEYRIPQGSVIPPGGFLLLDHTANLIGLSASEGETLLLGEVDPEGNLQRYWDEFSFGASALGESFGRWPDGTGAVYPMQRLTVEERNESDGNQPRIGPVTITEIHYNPDGPDENKEFITLFNSSTSSQDLGGWHLRGEIDFDFPEGTAVAPAEKLVLVAFDPANQSLTDAFRIAYPHHADSDLIGGWSGRLSDGGGELRLRRLLPLLDREERLVIEDRVRFDDGAAWPPEADGAGAWLLRRTVAMPGDVAGNWRDSTSPAGDAYDMWAADVFPTDAPPERTGKDHDFDGDGLTNFMEFAFLQSPVSPDGSDVITVHFADGDERFSIRFPFRSGAGLSFIPQWSSDLQAWETVAPRDFIQTNERGESGQPEIRIQFDRFAEELTKFFRVEVLQSE